MALDGELPQDFTVEYAQAADLGRLVAKDAPHQGLVLECAALEDVFLDDVLNGAGGRPIIVLDQVTDPHNVGAILRSAAAFGAAAIVTQDRHAPPESGVVAKSASGALELVPWVRVVNLARALEQMAEAGYWRIGLAGEVGCFAGAGPARHARRAWCSARKAKACGRILRAIAMRSPACRSRRRWKA